MAFSYLVLGGVTPDGVVGPVVLHVVLFVEVLATPTESPLHHIVVVERSYLTAPVATRCRTFVYFGIGTLAAGVVMRTVDLDQRVIFPFFSDGSLQLLWEANIWI